MAKVKETNCELCGKEAALRCEADSANLCYRCDAKVHGVNFLVARHVRVVLCCRCHQSTEISVSGPSPQAAQSFCFACCKSQGIKQTSHCTSTAESAFAGHVSSTFSNHSKGLRVGIDCKPVNDLRIAEGNMKACFREGVNEEAGTIERFEASIKEGDNEGTGAPGRSEVSINGWSYTAGASTTSSSGESQKEVSKPLVEIPKNEIDLLHTRSGRAVSNAEMQVKIVMSKWYRHLNLRSPSTLPLAMDFVEKGLQKLGALSRQKIRICLAASLWLAATLCEKQAYLPSVKKFEDCSGVPSKLILLAESRLGRLLRLKAQEEGSAECSS